MPRLPPLIELRAFEAAARHLSFNRAASELGVTPTAISHQVRLLERYCGVSLFRRRPRPVALTAAGSRLFPVVRDGLGNFAAAPEDLQRSASRGPLIVTTTNAFASRWLVPRLPDWRQHHPRTPLEVIGTDAVVDLQAGDAHLAIRYARTVPTSLRAHALLSDQFWPVCAPGLLPRKRALARPMALRGQTLIHCYWSASDPAAPTWQRWLAVARAAAHDVPELEDMTHLSFREEAHAIEAAIAGQGIAICSDVLVQRELAAGTLVKAVDLPLAGYTFFLVHAPACTRQRDVNAFHAWIKAQSNVASRTNGPA
jgi:LysR family glycine cleavage system transcriptional activator